jgi:DNA repair protein RadD
MGYTLRWYQQESVDSIFDYFKFAGGNPLVAMPTGTGKSLAIAGFIRKAIEMFPGQRFMCLTHVKELIEQNAEKLQDYWPGFPVGIYSAGLNRRDIMQPVIFGGIASVVNNIEAFGHRDLVLVDEAHLISPNEGTMYQKVLDELKRINPHLKVIGFTATPFRIGQGMLTDGGIFSEICYDLCNVDSFNRLIREGFLCPLIPKRTNFELDVSGVRMSRGDFANNQLQEAVDKQEITYQAIKEAVELGADRNSWLVFCAGIEHAEHVAEMLETFGIVASTIHSKIGSKERARRLAAWKAGEIQALTNNGCLTTGVDHPALDLIIMLRATMSPALWVQMLGRGTRPCEGKDNCLVLDFAGNTKRLGPINDPIIPNKKGKGTGDAPVKICEECGCYNHTSARECIACGFEFPKRTNLKSQAGTEELIKGSEQELPEVKSFEVGHVFYNLHRKKGYDAAPSVKVSYQCGLRMFSEWICPQHKGYAGKKAKDWWRCRHDSEPPETVEDFLERTAELRIPKKLRVWVNKKYPQIMNYEY